MMALSRYRIRHLASAGNRRAALVLNLLEQTERLLGVILLGNNIVNTAASALSATFAIYFQENHERLGIIVDEYGEVQGLVTLEDIIEEVIGEFTTSMPGASRTNSFKWDKNGECVLEGASTLREINKHLRLDFPLDGPKTLNGLVLEELRDIPEANVSVKMEGCVVEIIQAQNQAIKVVKLIRI